VSLLVFHTFLLGILIFKGLTALRLYKSFGIKGLISTAQALEGMQAWKWRSDQSAWCVIRYSATLWNDKENRALSVLYKYIRRRQEKQRNVSLCFYYSLQTALLQHTSHSSTRIPNLKSQQDCCQHHTIWAHPCHEISDQKKKNIERSISPAASSHPS
jgi:hypothetical protein